MNLQVIVPITTEPISLTIAKAHLRVIDTVEDNLISNLIKVARETAENITNRALATQTLELTLPEFPIGNIRLPRSPIQGVTSIKYKDSTGLIDTTWPAENYIVDTAMEPVEIALAYGKTYPSFIEYPSGAIKIIYVAGYNTTTNICPLSIKQAMLLLISTLYESRENVIIGQTISEIPFGVNALLYPYKIFSF